METTKTTFTEKVISGLRNAATELEELRVQASLGKAEAKDAFHSAKKSFNEYVHEAKVQLEEAGDVTKEKATELKSEFEHLRVQLALGAADAADSLEDQVKKIKDAVHRIENAWSRK